MNRWSSSLRWWCVTFYHLWCYFLSSMMICYLLSSMMIWSRSSSYYYHMIIIWIFEDTLVIWVYDAVVIWWYWWWHCCHTWCSCLMMIWCSCHMSIWCCCHMMILMITLLSHMMLLSYDDDHGDSAGVWGRISYCISHAHRISCYAHSFSLFYTHSFSSIVFLYCIWHMHVTYACNM